MKRSLLFAALLFALPAGAAQADDAPPQQCRVLRIISFDLGADEDGSVYIPMTFGDQTENMLVDTGGLLSMLAPRTVDTLGLHKSVIALSEVRMFGDKPVTNYVTVTNAKVGPMAVPRWDLFVLPDNGLPSDVAGIVAPDILSIFDTDFDFAAGKLNLYSPDHCPGKVVYWTKGDYAEIPVTVTSNHQIKVPVEVDGSTVTAGIDTGDYRTMMSWEKAKDVFGIDEKSPGVKVEDADPKHLSYSYTAKTLSFGGIVVKNPDLLLVPDAVSGMDPYRTGFDPERMIVGMNILRQLHVYIAYHEHKIYVTPASQH